MRYTAILLSTKRRYHQKRNEPPVFIEGKKNIVANLQSKMNIQFLKQLRVVHKFYIQQKRKKLFKSSGQTVGPMKNSIDAYRIAIGQLGISHQAYVQWHPQLLTTIFLYFFKLTLVSSK